MLLSLKGLIFNVCHTTSGPHRDDCGPVCGSVCTHACLLFLHYLTTYQFFNFLLKSYSLHKVILDFSGNMLTLNISILLNCSFFISGIYFAFWVKAKYFFFFARAVIFFYFSISWTRPSDQLWACELEYFGFRCQQRQEREERSASPTHLFKGWDSASLTQGQLYKVEVWLKGNKLIQPN
jgi:hypothetical protein